MKRYFCVAALKYGGDMEEDRAGDWVMASEVEALLAEFRDRTENGTRENTVAWIEEEVAKLSGA